MNAIKEKGLSIPDDIALVGFDDIHWAKNANPSLSTVRVEKEKIGYLVARSLINLIEGKKSPPVRITIPVKLVIRKSTGEGGRGMDSKP